MNTLKRIAPCPFAVLPFFILWISVLVGQSDEASSIEWLPAHKNVVSGSLAVPENHDDPDGRKIRITYVILKARDTSADAYPVIFFTGGPGGNTIDSGLVNFLLEDPLTANRDFILFDQRGIGYSSPMPNMGLQSFEILAKNANESEELELSKSMIENYKSICREKEIHPEYYNTFQNAKDVGMLFDFLRYEKYNLWGGSYGTRLARVVQDLFPGQVHSSILDSPAPLSTDFLLQRLQSFELALSRIFDSCNDNEDCRIRYPNLKKDYIDAIISLRERPIKVRLKDSSDFYINAQDGVYLLRRLLYQDHSRLHSN